MVTIRPCKTNISTDNTHKKINDIFCPIVCCTPACF
ncbi:MAG: ST-I family heat-stable enterotoxin [Flavobacteriaceae bacterium]|nr:ST-I family heat-stable enterotoxin [Flavobacteriaceae bacterium]